LSSLVDRVKYFRDKAARDRAKEEKELLEAEMDRTVTSFRCMKVAWQAMADKVIACPVCSSTSSEERCIHHHSRSAYAVKQVEMYERLETDAKLMQERAKVKRDIFDNWWVFDKYLIFHEFGIVL